MNAGAHRVGRKGWFGGIPEGKRIFTLQGDSFPAAHQPDTQLCKRVGEDRVEPAAYVVSRAFRRNTPSNRGRVPLNHFLCILNLVALVAHIFSIVVFGSIISKLLIHFYFSRVDIDL